MPNRAKIALLAAATIALTAPVIKAGTGAILPIIYALAGLAIYTLANNDQHE